MIAPVGVDLAEAFRGLADPPLGELRYRVYYGGRGGAKSWSFARALLIHGTERRHRILCTREYQNSIRDSVHKLLRDQVYQLGLDGFYSVEQARIYGANGTEFLFYGLKRDPHTIKGLEGVTLAWIEEAHTTSKESWEILDPTIREEGSEIWASFNPDQPTDPLYKLFAIDEPPARSLVRKVGWQDNPWLPEVLRHQRDEMYRRDPEAEAHVWGGNPWSKSDDQILRGRYRVEDFEPDDSWGDPLFGADWGFSQDPTVLVKLWLRDSRLWIEYDERGVGWSMAEIDRRFRRVPGASDYVIRGDCSRPETINELRQLGLRVQPAAKWTGSVEDGAEHLRSYEEIVIHPRCSGIIQEARLWRYKRDPRTDDVLPKIRDGNDHGWDAARYALEPIIRRRPSLRVLAHSPW